MPFEAEVAACEDADSGAAGGGIKAMAMMVWNDGAPWGEENLNALTVAGGPKASIAYILREDGTPEGVKFAANCLANVVNQSDYRTGEVIAAGGVAALVGLLTSDNEKAQQYAASALRNMSAIPGERGELLAKTIAPFLAALAEVRAKREKLEAAKAAVKAAQLELQGAEAACAKEAESCKAELDKLGLVSPV